MSEVFDIVAELPHGNAFANAGKAVDHFFAYGSHAMEAPLPRLHAGSLLPHRVITATRDILERHDLLPEAGYVG